jgi:2-haloacid dehalogenase
MTTGDARARDARASDAPAGDAPAGNARASDAPARDPRAEWPRAGEARAGNPPQSEPPVLEAPPGWVTFDCYGTLVDWRHGIRAGAEAVLPGMGEALLAGYHRHEAAVEAVDPPLRYRAVLAETLRRAAAEEGITLDDAASQVLATTLPLSPVFPDVAQALRALRASGWHLGVLTNCDRDLFAVTARRLPVRMDLVVTAEDAGSYKPALGHFARGAEILRGFPGPWVHVAQSYVHDVEPAAEAGVPCVWINRLGEGHDPSLAAAVRMDLTDLPAAVTYAASLGAGSSRSRDLPASRSRSGWRQM